MLKRPLMIAMTTLACVLAIGDAQALNLCGGPPKTCVFVPNWGLILPETTTGPGRPPLALSLVSGRGSDASGPQVTKTATDRLVRALGAASFDANNRLVAGGAAIRAAVANVRKEVPDGPLSISIDRPAGASSDFDARVAVLNDYLTPGGVTLAVGSAPNAQ